MDDRWLLSTLKQVIISNHEYLEKIALSLHRMVQDSPDLTQNPGVNCILFNFLALDGQNDAMREYFNNYIRTHEWVKPDPFMNKAVMESIAETIQNMPSEVKIILTPSDMVMIQDGCKEYGIPDPFESSGKKESPSDAFSALLQRLMGNMSPDDLPQEDCENCANLADCDLPMAVEWRKSHSDVLALPDGMGENDSPESEVNDSSFQDWLDSLSDDSSDESESPDKDD